MSSPTSAGHAIVRALEAHGVDRVFQVPGESFLDVLDGLYDSGIDTVVCRHEGGAAYAAEAAGRQGMFFEMHDLIFERQREWEKKPSARELFDGYARELDLDLARFATEFGDDAAREKVRRDTASGTLLRLQGTPSFFLNGALIENPRSYEEWVSLIRNAAPLP